MKQEIAWTNKTDVATAVNDLASQIRNKSADVNLVMFFAGSCYDFTELSKGIKELFPASEVVGCSTSGELGPNGFTKNSITLTTMSDSGVRVKGVLIPDATKYPIALKDNILAAMKSCGITPGGRHSDSFAITFANGLCNIEEVLASLLFSVVEDDDFRVIGGSAGDDLKFVDTFVSLNGEVVDNGGAYIFVKTNKKFTILKENIFRPTGRKLTVTKADTDKRLLIELDGSPAVSEYSKKIGANASTDLGAASLMNPLGRLFGNDIYIASFAGVNPDKTFSMYCRLTPNTKVDVMEVGDVKAIMNETANRLVADVPRPGFIFVVNCILRTLKFESTDEGRYLANLYQTRFGKFAGYSSYGEQIDRISSNQTLVVLAMEE